MKRSLIDRLKQIDNMIMLNNIDNDNYIALFNERLRVMEALNSINNSTINDSRERLNHLKHKKKEIDKEIESLTHHRCGKPYGKMLSKLIYEYIDASGKHKDTYERYKVYSKLRLSISNEIAAKTQEITSDEYANALNIIETKWKYHIPDKYR